MSDYVNASGVDELTTRGIIHSKIQFFLDTETLASEAVELKANSNAKLV